MKISDAFKNAGQVYFGHLGAAMKFLVIELCMTLAALSPLLFLTADGWMKWLERRKPLQRETGGYDSV